MRLKNLIAHWLASLFWLLSHSNVICFFISSKLCKSSQKTHHLKLVVRYVVDQKQRAFS